MFHPVKESVSDAMRFALHAMLATCLALIRPDLQVLFFVLLLPTWGRDGDIRLLKILSGVLTFLRANRFFRWRACGFAHALTSELLVLSAAAVWLLLVLPAHQVLLAWLLASVLISAILLEDRRCFTFDEALHIEGENLYKRLMTISIVPISLAAVVAWRRGSAHSVRWLVISAPLRFLGELPYTVILVRIFQICCAMVILRPTPEQMAWISVVAILAIGISIPMVKRELRRHMKRFTVLNQIKRMPED